MQRGDWMQRPYTRPHMSVVTFLTDYGLRDDFVGVCHAEMRIEPA